MGSHPLWGDLFFRGSDPEILLAPKLYSTFESTRPGVHIVGDLAGVPLLKNALNIGADTVGGLAADLKSTPLAPDTYHLVIVGAGAAGLAAALEAKQQGLRFVVIEQSRPAETIRNFHKNKPIFAEPAALPNRSRLWFEECRKEALLEAWDRQLAAEQLDIRAPVVFQGIEDRPLGGEDYRRVITDHGDFVARRVILAMGKAGNPRRLGIPGEDRADVHTALGDPDAFDGQRIAVVGAGDSAAEIALALCERNTVTLLVRRDRIDRPKKRNRDRLFEAAERGALAIHYNTRPQAIRDGAIECEQKGAPLRVETDHTILALGAELPLGLLRALGIRLVSDWDGARLVKLLGLAAVVAFFYLWKGGFLEPIAPFLYSWTRSLGAWTGGVFPPQPAMWAGALYSALVLVYGLACLKKYRNDPYQRRRYKILIVAQVLFLWVLPEIVFQGVLALQDGWRSYGLFIPAPLYVWNFNNPAGAHAFWFVWALLFSFVGVPLYSKYTGKKYCAYVCGCGCLAETFGDRWRHLAPRGRRARAWELLGEWLVLALVGSFVLWGVVYPAGTGWTWQKLLVDTVLAGIVGVATYPFFGNRIWCRFLCPLSRIMHVAAANLSSVKISCGAHCIECGLCSKYCQMGIPVMEFAKNGEDFDNKATSCIQCGICVTVCPVRNLQNGEWDEALWQRTVKDGALTPLR